MAAMPAPLRRLVEQLTRLPGVGEKSATRLAFFLLRADTEYAQALAEAITAIKREIRLCSRCLGFTEQEPCALCTDSRRTDACSRCGAASATAADTVTCLRRSP